MGVKISELLPKKDIKFEDLAGKAIALDFSNVCYQFLASIRQPDGTPLQDSQGRATSHLMGIWTRFSSLIDKGIKLAVVFDGKPPLLKLKEQENRALRKDIASSKLKKATQEEDIDAMAKYSKQTIRLSREMVEESKLLIQYMGMPIIQAPSEADAQISFMCEKGDVFAAGTSDVDPLLYSCPRIITNLTLSQKRKLSSGSYVWIKPQIVELSEVLNSLKITQDQLLALAILVGTDYNVSGVERIGPKTALKLVKQYKNFDRLFRDVKASFNWKEIYAVFKSMPIMKNYQLKWRQPNFDKISGLLVDNHDFSEDRVEKTFKRLSKQKEAHKQKGLGEFM